MNAERWQQIERIYHGALECAPDARAEYLREACAADAALLQEVESLLAEGDPRSGLSLSPERPSQLPTLRLSQFNPGSAAPGNSLGPFRPGTLVAQRFRIETEIAEGGMGVVYRATDEKLNQPRALKVAKWGFDGHLPPEARTALRVTHPNVCRVFEIHTTQTPAGPVDFLSMEFIEGGTLADRLRTDGPFADAAALDLADQICAGITAAHVQSVLHRDLKSNNVLLTQKADGSMRAVVTDFGLARESPIFPSTDGGNAAMTTLSGTPAYIAPERWQGKPSSVASDIFALGIVLHEIVTGKRPKGNGPESREVDATIPTRWRNVITRCLAADPTKRFPSAAAVADALSGRAARTRRRWLAAAAVALASSLAAWRIFAPAVTPPARLAVLSVDAPGADGQTASLVRAAGLEFSSRMMRLRPRPPQLVVIPVEETQGISPSQATTAKLRLGASHILRASATPAGNHLMLRGAIVDTATGVVVREASQEISSASEIAPNLATLVGAAFNLPRQTQAETVAPAAWPDYAAGLNSLRARQYAQAIASFEKAVALDPSSPLPAARLAESYSVAWDLTSDTKYLDRGRELLTKAVAMSPDSLAVHLAAGKLNLAPGSWQRAAEEFQRAIQLDPASAEGWDGLAHAYEGMQGRQRDAADAYLKAIAVQPDYYGALTNFGLFKRRQGDYPGAEKYFRQSTDLAPESPVLHANIGGFYIDMGRYQDAERELKKAMELDPKMRSVLNNLGALYQYLGRDRDAAAAFERARATGTDSYILALNLGDSYRRLGNATAASEAYRRGRKLADARLLANPGDYATRAFLAYFAIRLGDNSTAERELSQALYFASQDHTVIRRAVLNFEALRQRDRSLALLQTATPDVIRELNRHPDLAGLRQDPKFIALLPASN